MFRVLIAVATLLPSGLALAFIDNMRHGYQNCTACHVSPNGGGVLTDYGRALSSEIMSSFGSENFAQFAHGMVALPEWLKIGGDIRAVQTYVNTPSTTSGKFFLMQDNLELAGIVDKFAFVGDIGTSEGPVGAPNKGTFLSERHYALFHASDESSLRAGKFEMQYGINDPNHLRAVRQGTLFGPYSETYNLEFSYLTQHYNAFVTSVLGRIDDPNRDVEKGFALSAGYYLGTTSTVGLSAYLGENSTQRRDLKGIYTLISFTKNLFWQGEVDFQNLINKLSSVRTAGVFSSQKFGYELFKGIIPYILHDVAFPNVDQLLTRTDDYGIGIQLLPLPHFEFTVEYQKQRNQLLGDFYTDYGYLVGHYYF